MTLLHGDCLEHIKQLPDNSVDSLVTDPPAGISFMGKAWDDDKGGRLQWIGWLTLVMSECKRVMKPGAHGLVWALPRTSHWTATALEEAGFEIRDVVTHLFGSGFPKSLDVSKAIDKAAGASRVAIGKNPNHRQAEDVCTMLGNPHTGDGSITAPATDAAKQWQGFGTALKPASEHWILIRKPLSEKTVAANVLKWGTGALNIDGSRVATQDNLNGGAYAETKGRKNATYGKLDYEAGQYKQPQGRFPANLIFSCPCDSDSHMLGCAVGELDRQSGQSKSSNAPRNNKNTGWKCSSPPSIQESPHSDSGGASRFFYVAKVSAAERNAGLEGMQKKRIDRYGECGQGATPQQTPRQTREETNHHPTVKPQKLMRYLIRMATPPGGTVLDPFMGSGTTGCAAIAEGFGFIGIEREAEYLEIARRRIEHASE